MAALINYRKANQQATSPLIEWEEGEGEKKTLDIRQALSGVTAFTTPSTDGFIVDSGKTALVAALDKSPWVYRAGGQAAAGSSAESFD